MPSIQSSGGVRAEQDEVLLLTCDVDYGASAPPFLFVRRDGGHCLIFGDDLAG